MTCVKQPLNVNELRLLVDDMYPDNQSFADEQYLTMYIRFENIYRLAAHIWMLKSTRLQSQTGGIKSYSSGDEKYEMSAFADMYKYYTDMRDQMIDLAKQYEKDCSDEFEDDSGSLILSVRAPDII